MIKGIGTDIIEIDRFRSMMENHSERFKQRLFTKEEVDYCLAFKDSEKHFAARFAAKEAVAKALGKGFGKTISATDVAILNDEGGAPFIKFSDRLKEELNDPKVKVSLSHCQAYAMAMAIWF